MESVGPRARASRRRISGRIGMGDSRGLVFRQNRKSERSGRGRRRRLLVFFLLIRRRRCRRYGPSPSVRTRSLLSVFSPARTRDWRPPRPARSPCARPPRGLPISFLVLRFHAAIRPWIGQLDDVFCRLFVKLGFLLAILGRETHHAHACKLLTHTQEKIILLTLF